MDDIDLADKIRRVIEERQELIQTTMMDGLLRDIEHYRSLQGELTALNLIQQEVSQYFKDNKV